MNVTVKKPQKPLKGIIEIPSDKSISHRAAMFSALTKGVVKISNFSKGADCRSTLGIMKQLGCEVSFKSEKTVIIDAKNALTASKVSLDCGNSGTTMRLMSGLLAGQNFDSELHGDESLSKRPMKRVIEPLELMGAKILHHDYKAPLSIKGSILKGINYDSKLSSAQVKSCLLLAGLYAEGITTISEPYKSRNHTELMLDYLGADIKLEKNKVSIQKSGLTPKDLTICGDISSAAFFIVAALIIPDSEIIIKNVGVNPTRSGILEVLKKMNADIEVLDLRFISNEPVADIKVRYSDLKATLIDGAIIPKLIDELPILAVAASQAEGKTVIKDAEDLRNKESDRITCLVSELRKIGVDIQEQPDGFIVYGKTKLTGDAKIECYHDHRIAMSSYVAGMICKKPIVINEFHWVNISFPEFEELIFDLI